MKFIKGVFHSVLTAVLSTCIIGMLGIGTIAATDINSFLTTLMSSVLRVGYLSFLV